MAFCGGACFSDLGMAFNAGEDYRDENVEVEVIVAFSEDVKVEEVYVAFSFQTECLFVCGILGISEVMMVGLLWLGHGSQRGRFRIMAFSLQTE